jgi:hypothetical protein
MIIAAASQISDTDLERFALFNYGARPDMIRAKIAATLNRDGSQSTQIVIQPSDNNKIEEFLSNSKFNANFVDHISVVELNNGGIIDLNGNHGHCEIPLGLSLNTNDVYFWQRERPLNEFGMIYVDLFIGGNYARYYPHF